MVPNPEDFTIIPNEEPNIHLVLPMVKIYDETDEKIKSTIFKFIESTLKAKKECIGRPLLVSIFRIKT